MFELLFAYLNSIKKEVTLNHLYNDSSLGHRVKISPWTSNDIFLLARALNLDFSKKLWPKKFMFKNPKRCSLNSYQLFRFLLVNTQHLMVCFLQPHFILSYKCLDTVRPLFSYSQISLYFCIYVLCKTLD